MKTKQLTDLLAIPQTILATEIARQEEEKARQEEIEAEARSMKNKIVSNAFDAIFYNAKALTPEEIFSLIDVDRGDSIADIVKKLEERGALSTEEGRDPNRSDGYSSFRLSLNSLLSIAIDQRYGKPEISLDYPRGGRQKVNLCVRANRDEACRLIVLYAEATLEEIERASQEESDKE